MCARGRRRSRNTRICRWIKKIRARPFPDDLLGALPEGFIEIKPSAD
jgi:hypothetical protein